MQGSHLTLTRELAWSSMLLPKFLEPKPKFFRCRTVKFRWLVHLQTFRGIQCNFQEAVVCSHKDFIATQEESPTIDPCIWRHCTELKVISRGRSHEDFIATQEDSKKIGAGICRHSAELDVISRGRSHKDFIAMQEESPTIGAGLYCGPCTVVTRFSTNVVGQLWIYKQIYRLFVISSSVASFFQWFKKCN